MNKDKRYTTRVFSFLLVILMIITLTACDDDGKETTGSGTMQDPYVAYGLERENSYDKGETLEKAMQEKPPAAIQLQLMSYYRMYYKMEPISGELSLEKGKSESIPIDLEIVHNSGEKINIKANINLKYDGKKGEDLFHVDTSTYGNPTLYIDGKYITEFGQHDVQNKAVNMQYIGAGSEFIPFNGPAEEFLYIPLHVDKGNATKGDGNMGIVYLRITGVKF